MSIWEEYQMPVRKVELRASEGVFVGLSKQNMLFHQCIFELCDNSIAAAKEETKISVYVAFETIENEPDYFNLYVCDNGKGMDIDTLEESLQLGHEPTSTSRLNEHGFGLKNSLATLSGGNGWWKIWTKQEGENVIFVEGPFGPNMEIVDEDDTVFPDKPFIPADAATVVMTKVKKTYSQTVQGRGAKASDLQTIRSWLVEHLGVAYRGYLSLDEITNDTKARISVSIGNDHYNVTPIHVPIAHKDTKYIDIELNGATYQLKYIFGTLDEVNRDALVKGKKAKFYYQGNIATQGIDIRLGDRVIATKQFETIWTTNDGKQITRHNAYNDFVGELQIPDLPRGVLTTVNNKTDFNLDDPEWGKIFDLMDEYRPKKSPRELGEKELKEKWISMLKATNPKDSISDEYNVWNSGVRIDVFRQKVAPDNSIILYELKVGSAAPIHLYQLKMYWDGLILEGKQPDEAILLVEDYTLGIEEMANKMNNLTPPFFVDGKQSKAYNFKLTKHSDIGLK